MKVPRTQIEMMAGYVFKVGDVFDKAFRVYSSESGSRADISAKLDDERYNRIMAALSDSIEELICATARGEVKEIATEIEEGE